ncbi:hypothetical protein CIB48_g9369 [Xylaria polymorpha]|nr:hypothetical protein CIB48_g9369 [Xylaria polymorpha]
MKFFEILITAATIIGAAAAPPPTEKRASRFQFVGVSEAGAEFGGKNLPGQLGRDYIWPGQNAINLTGAIDQAYANGLDQTVNFITGKGAYAVIDPHNYGWYYNNIITDVNAFGAFWTTVARCYASNSRVIFDTNNEFHDEDNTLVANLNQRAINAIRGAGATSQYIFVEGNSWAGAGSWVSSGTADGMGKLTDPSNKLIYEMHQYLDSDGSGSSATCVSTTIGKEQLQAATAWLKANHKKAIIGETAGGANPQCIAALQGMLGYMADNSDVWAAWLWWGAGPWWGNYIYGMEPPSGVAYTGVLPSLTQYI